MSSQRTEAATSAETDSDQRLRAYHVHTEIIRHYNIPVNQKDIEPACRLQTKMQFLFYVKGKTRELL